METSSQVFTTYSWTVTKEECDSIGHLNVQYYVRAIGDGVFSLFDQLGWTPLSDSLHLDLVGVRMTCEFTAEAWPGDRLVLRSRIEGIDSKSVKFDHSLHRDAGELEVMRCAVTGVFIDRTTRQPQEVPNEFKELASRKSG